MKIILLPALLIALTLPGCHAQKPAAASEPTTQPAKEVAHDTVKPSPAEEALNRAAKDAAADQKAFDTALEQAKVSLEAQAKDLQKQNVELNQQLNTQLRADKKYKPMFDKIVAIQKQMATLNTDAGNKFQQSVGSIQNNINSNRALVRGLEPIVRQEHGWPATATYDAATQTWKGIPAPPAEEKK